MERPTKDCVVCKSKTTDNFCSKTCQTGQMCLLDTEKAIKDHKYDKNDTRIFFFDHPLSELFDLYTKELLKSLHSKNIKKQHYHWNRANLYLKTILTKINKDYVSDEVLREYAQFIQKMYYYNAEMWDRKNDFHKMTAGLKYQAEYMNRYFDLDEAKSTLKNEIDIYCGLQPYNEKEYNG